MKLHGNARVQATHVTPDGLTLGRWVQSQRNNISKNLLSKDRVERLEALPGWSWNPITEQWEEEFRQIQTHVKMHGNAKVPQKHVTPDGLNLGIWISNQRQNKSKNLLSQDRIERLEALPGWSWDPITEKWEEAFEQLQTYVKLNGNAKVPDTHVTPDGLTLGRWVGFQRKKKSQNILSQDRIERLEALPGWSWGLFAEQWEEAFGQLQIYVKLNGNAKVPHTHVTPDGLTLGRWVGCQRKKRSQNILSQDRIESLEALPGWVWSFKKETE